MSRFIYFWVWALPYGIIWGLPIDVIEGDTYFLEEFVLFIDGYIFDWVNHILIDEDGVFVLGLFWPCAPDAHDMS